MESASWQQVWSVRGHVYSLLGNIVLSVMDGAKAACLEPGFWEAFPLEAANGHMERSLAALGTSAAELAALGRDDAVHVLAADYTRLFVGPGEPPAPLWESLYREGGKFLFGKPTFDMRQLFRDHGMKLDESVHQLEDHLGVELLYLAKTAERFAENEPAQQDVEEQATFIDEHVLWWVPELHRRVAEHARQEFYPALIELVWGVLLWDRELLEECCAA